MSVFDIVLHNFFLLIVVGVHPGVKYTLLKWPNKKCKFSRERDAMLLVRCMGLEVVG